MRIPPNADAEVQQAFRELHERLDRFGLNTTGTVVNARGTRIINAGDALQASDYVTRRQLQQHVLDAIRTYTRTPTLLPPGPGQAVGGPPAPPPGGGPPPSGGGPPGGGGVPPPGTVAAAGYWTPITNGDPLVPEILFDSGGDCIVGFVPTP